MSSMSTFKPQDAERFRNLITEAVKLALASGLGAKTDDLAFQVKSSSISHNRLDPKGDQFVIALTVDVYEKDKKKSEE